MIFTIYKASDDNYCDTKKFKSLEDLENFQKVMDGYDLIIDFDYKQIIIYDDYIE
jgi:hypothetical protein